MMPDPILEIRSVTKNYGKKSVLKGIDLIIYPMQHIGLVGNNGQGKTTLLKLILGLLKVDSGEVIVKGKRITSHRSVESKRLFGYLPETVSFYPNLSGRETLHYFARLKQQPKSSVDELLAMVGLQQVATERLKVYSKGMRQRLGLAQALLGKPEILLLDEPTNGLDPSGIHEFYLILEHLQESGVAVLMASHLLAEVEPRLDRLAVLRSGQIEHFGTVEQLIADSGLPSRIDFRIADMQTASCVMNRLNTAVDYHRKTDTFSIRCSTKEKIPLLRKLTEFANDIEGLEVSDPNLEQLFLSFNGSHHEIAVPSVQEITVK